MHAEAENEKKRIWFVKFRAYKNVRNFHIFQKPFLMNRKPENMQQKMPEMAEKRTKREGLTLKPIPIQYLSDFMPFLPGYRKKLHFTKQ